MALFDQNLLIYAIYVFIGFVAGRILTAVEYAVLKSKHESYKILNVSERFSHSFSTAKSPPVPLDISHEVSGSSGSFYVLDPNYYRELTPQETAAKYYIEMEKRHAAHAFKKTA